MNYRLSLLAERDLADIAQSTLEHWGSKQAQQYGQTLADALQQLADYPLMGKQRADIYPDARSHSVGSHIVFYRLTANGIDVARVLHQRMDAPAHF